jgi:asparagine synthase (glutamine-hydrolysing)
MLKLKKAKLKWLLREAAKSVIPTDAYKKKKLGFPVPLREWIKEPDLYNMIKEEFMSDNALKLFNQKRILKLLEDHKSGKKDNYKKVWTIYTFLVWYKQFFGEEA